MEWEELWGVGEGGHAEIRGCVFSKQVGTLQVVLAIGGV